MRPFTTALCALFMVTGAAQAAFSQETLKVAVPQRGSWDAGLAELGHRGGIFKKHGLNLEILYTQAGPELIQALIAGSVDIATASGVQAAFGTFGKGAPIRIISSEIIGSPDLFWYVPGNSPIRKIEDFNGKTVAYSLTGSSSHAGLLALIAQYKLTAKPTSTGSITGTLTQTMTGQVDVGFCGDSVLPRSGRGRPNPDHRHRQRGRALKTRTGRVNLTNLTTLQNRKDALVRFHGAYKETVDWMYSDPAALKISVIIPAWPRTSCAGARARAEGGDGARSRRRHRSDHRRGGEHEVPSDAADARAGQGIDPNPDELKQAG